MASSYGPRTVMFTSARAVPRCLCQHLRVHRDTCQCGLTRQHRSTSSCAYGKRKKIVM